MFEDISDEGLVARFGDILFEIPELFEALRFAELQSRHRHEGAFRCRAGRVSVERDGAGLQMRIGLSRR